MTTIRRRSFIILYFRPDRTEIYNNIINVPTHRVCIIKYKNISLKMKIMAFINNILHTLHAEFTSDYTQLRICRIRNTFVSRLRFVFCRQSGPAVASFNISAGQPGILFRSKFSTHNNKQSQRITFEK